MLRLLAILSVLAFTGMTVLGFAQQAAKTGAGQQPLPTTHLKVGEMAPDFTLPDQNNKPVTLSSFRGKKNVVLAFYVLAFTSG